MARPAAPIVQPQPETAKPLLVQPSQPLATAPRAVATIAPDPVPPVKPKAPLATPPQPPRDVIDLARDLVQGGRVGQARSLLLEAAQTDRPAIALLLARSYDPNYLATLSTSDATPDIPQARKWYTRWYELASKQGEVPQTMRLDLLLRSLDAATAKQ